MKNILRKVWPVLIFVLVALLLTGCLNVKTLVKVKPNGSGTVEQTYLMHKDIVAMIAAFSPEGEKFSLMDKDKLTADASSLGDGVKFQSAEPVTQDNFEGYKVVYSFDTITKLKLNQNPGDLVPGQDEPSPKEYLGFEFQAASGATPAKLTVTMPEQEAGPGSEPAAESSDEDLEAAKQMFENMKIGLFFECGTSIVSTTATHRAGNTVTLMDLDFGKIVENEELFNKLMKDDPRTIEMLKVELLGIPGIKIESKPTVEINFK